MKRLQFYIFALFIWFFVFYNVERVLDSINLASFVYLLAPAMGMLVLSVPRLLQNQQFWYFPLAIISVVALRWQFGYELTGPAFSVTVTEGLAIWITIGLSYQLAHAIDEYQSAAATAICSHLVDRCRPFEEAQAEIMSEVRRARHFGRPIAVLALRPQPINEQQTLDRFTDEFKKRLLAQYISARAVDCLSTHLRQHDMLTEMKGEFLALMPELSREDAENLAVTMRHDLRKQLGIDLHFGISMFPEDHVTAVGLVEHLEAESERVHAIATSASAAIGVAPSDFDSMHSSPADLFGRDRREEPLPR